MNLYLKIILILLGLAYLISPVDIIPDLLLPYVGWIDDGVVLWSIFHLIRYGTLPPIFPALFGQKQTASKMEPKPKKKKPSQDKPLSKPAHEILGVSPKASWEEIQTAYKHKIKQYHPDKLSHLGEEFSSLANEKFLEIQKAYDALKEQKNRGNGG